MDFPVAEVSWDATWEKSSQHGHPFTVHQWLWKQRLLRQMQVREESLSYGDNV